MVTPVSVYTHSTQYCSCPFFSGAFVAVPESPQFQTCHACSALVNGRLQRLLAALMFALLLLGRKKNPQTPLMKPRTGKRSFFLASEQFWTKLVFSGDHWKQSKDHCQFTCIFHSFSQGRRGCGFMQPGRKQTCLDFSLRRCLWFWFLSTCGFFMHAYTVS